MTIASAASEITYDGNGVTTVFAIPFVFDTSADLKVIRTDSSGNPVVLGSGFSVSGGGGATGSLTMSTAPASGEKLTILDDPERTQTADYTDNDSFPADVHEAALDRNTRLSKRLYQIIQQCLRVSDGDPSRSSGVLLPSVTSRKGKFLFFNATTGAVEVADVSTTVGALSKSIISNLLYPQTNDESNAGATVTDTSIPSHEAIGYVIPERYGARSDSTTDSTNAMKAAVAVALQGCRQVGLLGSKDDGEYKIVDNIDIVGSITIFGAGHRASRILCVGCNGLTIPAGVSSVKLRDFRIAQSVRHTTTPNTYVAVDVQGTTANPCDWHEYTGLLIDGFETPFAAAGVQQSRWDNCITVFGKHGIIAPQLTVNNRVNSCLFAGSGSGSYGIKIGDNSAAAEGWTIEGGTLLYGFARGVWGSGASNCTVVDTLIDFFSEFGILLNGTVAATANWTISDNYIAGSGTADTGIYCTNAAAPSLQRGHRIHGNQVFAYGGSTLANGILIDGAQEAKHLITGNSVKANTYDCRITVGTDHIIAENQWLGAGYSATVRNIYRNNSGTFLPDPSATIKQDPYTHIRADLTYSASISTDVDLGDHFTITATNTSAFTINAPTNPVTGKRITYTIRNNSGGALGAITWNAVFKLGTFTNPANGNSRSIEFAYNGTNWVQVSNTSVDVPN